jgi:hypothetical protein
MTTNPTYVFLVLLWKCRITPQNYDTRNVAVMNILFDVKFQTTMSCRVIHYVQPLRTCLFKRVYKKEKKISFP